MSRFRFRISIRRAMLVVAASALIIWGLIETVGKAIEDQRRHDCANNLKAIGLGLHNYWSVFDSFPTGTIGSRKLQAEKRLGWLAIMPMLTVQSGNPNIDGEQPWDSKRNLETDWPAHALSG